MEQETKTINKVKNFYERHPEKLTEKFVCKVCNGRYAYFNKSHHNKTQKHLLILRIIKDFTD